MRWGFDRSLVGRIGALAAPVVLGMVSQTAINLLDTVFVGRLPKEYSIPGQAAMGHALILLWAFGGFLSAISVGTQALTARRHGEGQLERAGQALTNSLLIALVSGVVVTAIAVIATPYIFPFFNENEDVIRLGVPFTQARMVGVLSMVATASLKSFFDGLGRTRVHMAAALVMNVVNAALNLLLVFGLLGFPQLFVFGSGLASAIASYLGLFLMLAWTLRRADRERYRYFRWSNVNRRIIWEIVRLSVPSGLATVAVMSGFAIFLKIVSDIDAAESGAVVSLTAVVGHGAGAPSAVYTAATKVIIDVLSIAFMSCIAFGTATATLVSQSLGARRPDLAERYGWESVKLGAAIVGAFGLFSVLFPDLVLGIFSKDIEVIDAARPVLRMMGLGEWMIAVGLICAQALFGAGNTKFVMYAEMILHFTCLVPLAYVFGVVLEWGLMGVWGAALTYIALLAGVMAWKFYEGKWKLIRL